MNKERTKNEHAGMDYSQKDRSKMKEIEEIPSKRKGVHCREAQHGSIIRKIWEIGGVYGPD